MNCQNCNLFAYIINKTQIFRSITFYLADPDLLATDPPDNAMKFETQKRKVLTATLLFIGFLN